MPVRRLWNRERKTRLIRLPTRLDHGCKFCGFRTKSSVNATTTAIQYKMFLDNCGSERHASCSNADAKSMIAKTDNMMPTQNGR